MSDLGWCIFCKLPMMKLMTDKRGRPYATCQACSTRSFFKRQDAYDNFLALMEKAKKTGEPAMLEMIGRRLGMVKPIDAPMEPAPAPASQGEPSKEEVKT